MFFDDWAGLVRVLVVGALAYTAMLVMLRVSGKRTLSKLNAFDLIVTVALGSTLATVLLSKDVPLVEGMLAFAVLIFAQYLITALSVRSSAVRGLVKSEPRLLFYQGKMLDDALRHERVTKNELLAVARSSGYADMAQVGAVILETDGSFNVLALTDTPANPTLKDVRGAPDSH
ncbi:MAG TPA: DUF421 domain-containing protein [Pseudomonas xinjiangensis]|uniref:DUF421 domain-containing protein n=2 Tax=root TaxID=1 RepID=A0A7V1FRQ7_9GAMM|nr:DUF421 domain-containing protein [Halopseudomonas xinjiangensis]HEC46404.1 DUF421 domain-containing protein [Halopseudomonas xinjiangensis]